MKWREAIVCSSVGIAERDSTANEREPWRVYGAPSKKSNKRVMVFAGRRKKRVGSTTVLSKKLANKFDDWYPYMPISPLHILATAAE